MNTDPSSQLSDQIRMLFDALIDCSDAERQRKLDELGRDQPAVAAEVRRLLVLDRRFAHAQGTPQAAAQSPIAVAMQASHLGQHIGAYRIVRLLGAGGMGAVFLGERAEGDIIYNAAIKVLRPDTLSPASDARFQVECQALAILDHPNIARLFDVGRLADGSPYLVMEYVTGTLITDYCDTQRLDLRARLRLFREVCAAVADAHRRLIVHRDLKPGNILVTPEGRVKLLDFGIAKPLAGSLGALVSDDTGTQQRLFSPLHAAPEQLSGAPITVGCDVYALGVLLYELLCGLLPFDAAAISAAEFEQLVLHRAPPAPSQRVRRLATENERIAELIRARQMSTPRALARDLGGDLDGIVLTCLRKTPAERYATVDQLDADVERYLDGYPVHARRGHRWYRVRKFAGRHRLGVAATGVVAALLAGAGAALWLQVIETTHQRDHARRATDFLVEAFRAADPEKALGETLTAKQILDQAQRTLDVELNDDPELKAELLARIAEVKIHLSEYKEALGAITAAEEQLDRVHAAQSELRSGLWELRARISFALSDHKAMEIALDHAEGLRSPLRTQVAIADDRVKLMVVQGETAKLKEYIDHVLNELLPRLSTDDPLRYAVAVRVALASIYVDDVSYGTHLLEDMLHSSLARLPDNHPSVLEAKYYLAWFYINAGRFDDAATLAKSIRRATEDLYGAESLSAARVAVSLGDALADGGHPVEALSEYRQALAINLKTFGPRHKTIATVKFNMAGAEANAELWNDADRDFRECIQLAKEVWPEKNTNAAMFTTAYALFLNVRHRFREAAPLFEEVVRRVDVDPEFKQQDVFSFAALGLSIANFALTPDDRNRTEFEKNLDISRNPTPEMHKAAADQLEVAKFVGLVISDDPPAASGDKAEK